MQYAAANPTPVTTAINDQRYMLDAAAMTQQNCSSSKIRCLRRLGNFEWECLTDKGWVGFEPMVAVAIERGYLDRLEALISSSRAEKSVDVTRGGVRYRIDLEALTQVNLSTSFARKVRRLGPSAWEFQGDGGNWTPYPESERERLERIFTDKAAPRTPVALADGKHTVDVGAMRQTGGADDPARSVRRLGDFAWAWLNGNRWMLYDAVDALALERALWDGATAPVVLRSGKYRVDVAGMRQVNVATAFERPVRRNSPWVPARQFLDPDAPPASWTKADGFLVDLAAGSAEWQDVTGLFGQTAGARTVLKVQRVQNHQLWVLFAAFRRSLGPGRTANERRLFHGTDRASADKIVVQGFNRSFVSTHAFGMGTYFARDASYSASSSYSKPDADGTKRMFLARVVVGDVCVGKSTDKVPSAARPGAANPLDLCDTTVNDAGNPSIFVTYKDPQQYPDYLITFKD
jgi:poly [ADP-ribose] polymerase 10/14/15